MEMVLLMMIEIREIIEVVVAPSNTWRKYIYHERAAQEGRR